MNVPGFQSRNASTHPGVATTSAVLLLPASAELALRLRLVSDGACANSGA